MKRLFGLALSIATMISLIGCSNGSAVSSTAPANSTAAPASSTTGESSAVKSGKSAKIAYTTMTLSSPYFTEVSDGIQKACKDRGWECTVQDPKMDAASQMSAIEDFIQQKYDGIIISAVDSPSMGDVVKKAQKAGIKVIGSSTKIDGEDAFVCAGEREMGSALGTALGSWCQGNMTGNLTGVTFGTINDPNVMIREQGMRDGFSSKYMKGKISWINKVGTIGGVNSDDGMKNMEGILQSHPDINIIMGSNDDGVLGAYEAAKSAGKDLNKMAFGGVNAVDEALKLIKSEKDAGKGAYRATVDITPEKHGEKDIEVMEGLLNGKTFPDQVMIPATAVTWDNINNYFK